ncbi:hypothetical protein KJ975_03675 [Myxococcota bacterium]|nr:hypothetical protein [Myxococcota bacterium]
MRAMHRLFLWLLLFQLGIAGCQEKSSPPAPPTPTVTPSPATAQPPSALSSEDTWVVQGDFRLLDGSLRSGGGISADVPSAGGIATGVQSATGASSGAIPAGERLLVTLQLGGLVPGTDLEAGFEIANGRGTWMPVTRQVLPAAQVRGPTGMMQAVLQTGSRWPAGAFTLQVTLTAGAKKGEIFVPFQLESPAPPAGGQQVSLPAHIRAGAPMTIRLRLAGNDKAPGIAPGTLTARIDDGPAVAVPIEPTNPPGGHASGALTVNAPATPGKHAVFFTRKGADGREVTFGEPFEVQPDAPGPFGLRFVTHDGGLRTRWSRRQEGFLLIEDPHWPEDAPGTLDVVIVASRDEVLYLRRLPLPARPDGPVSLPFSVPEFSPAGKLRFRLRWTSGTRHVELEHSLMVEGADLTQSPHFTISGLELGLNPALVRPGRERLPSGRDWHFSFVATGYKTGKKIEKAGVAMVPVPVLGLTCAATLSVVGGPVVAQNRDLVKIDQPMLYVPPRHRVTANWKLPRLAPGRYLMRLECDDVHSSGSAQLQRPIVIE